MPKAERELLAETEQLAAAGRYFALTRDLLCAASPDGWFQQCNAAWTQVLGWSDAELRSRRIIEFVHPDDRDAMRLDTAPLQNRGGTAAFVSRCATKDGGWRWLDWKAATSMEDGLIYASARDVSERHAAEAALAASQRNARWILETAHDAFISFDSSGLITDWNPQAERTFGWSRDEVLGTDLSETVIPVERRAEHRLGLRRLLADGGEGIVGERLERTMLDRTGRVFPAELTVSAHISGLGTTFSMFLRDITDRKAAERELAQARDEALEASRMKSMFVANVSHEIRTPMNGVIGMTELLLDTPLDDQQRGYAETISSSGESLLEIIDVILDFSKIEAGKLELDPTDFDLREAIERACGMLAARAQKKSLELVVAVEPDIPALVHGDAGRLRQIVANLVSNAIKFTAAGEVVVRVACRPEGETASRVRVEVSDTGIGIAPDALPELFKPFSQAESSTTRRYGGTGLGLAISRQLVELMGGTIGVASEQGAGSCFWFQLSLARAEGGRSAAVQRREVAGLRVLVVDDNDAVLHAPREPRRRIRSAVSAVPAVRALGAPRVLVVEDTAVNQAVAVQMLEHCGCESDVAENGQAALDALARRSYAAVLMDCQMPELDGYETTREIRRREQGGPRVPIVAMTASSMQGERERCLAAGMDEYLTKPLRNRVLEDALAAVGVMRADEPELLLDAGVIAGLDMLGADVVASLVELYFSEAAASVSELADALALEDARRVGAAAHKLKGNSATVGAVLVAQIASELESAAAKADMTATALLSGRLRDKLHETRKAFTRRMSHMDKDAEAICTTPPDPAGSS